ncbi:hypothetical protein [Jannaschia sp. LMIT008]|uniref:hypothetical protein n=1 Tax=Jannaschia maritima TaxID=3032585 RepID=UPI002812506D|nr:hypothetical protein [Jannaschia sp. LMIT008]
MRRPLLALVFCAALPPSAPAAERMAQVLVPADGTGAEVALDVSRALLEAGYDSLRRRGATLDTIRDMREAELAVVYLSGQPAADWDPALVAELAGASRLLIATDACGLRLPETLPDGVALAAPLVAEDGTCAAGPTAVADRLVAALRSPGTVFPDPVPGGDAREDGVATVGVLDAPLAAARVRPVGNGIVLGGPVLPAAPLAAEGAVLMPAALPRAAATATPSDLAARPAQPGLPRPSVIVGRLPGTDDDVLTGSDLGTDTFDARQAMRERDPDTYASLVASGVYDPPTGTLPAAIQTALQRMGCYRLTVDGAWGPGSRRAVAAYYDARGDAAPGDAASIALFRDVILREDVDCPEPVAAPTPARTASPARTGGTQRQARPARTATPRPAQPAATPRSQPSAPLNTISPSVRGVFR